MVLLQIAFGLFAIVMLVRHVPLAVRALREEGELGRRLGRSSYPIVNVLLAVVILAVAILALVAKGLAGHAVSR
jgi:hypothetical protein